jgi:hypothetical protein
MPWNIHESSGQFMSKGKAISLGLYIDASDLDRIAANLIAVTDGMGGVLHALSMAAAKNLAERLGDAAPQGHSAANDKRYPIKLMNSFGWRYSGVGTYEITTKTPQKYSWTNFGAKPPTFGSGYIFPRIKKMLGGPNFRHPVPWVENHPGVTGTMWAEKVIDTYMPGDASIPMSAQFVATTTADWYVQTFTNLNNGGGRGIPGNRGNLFAGILGKSWGINAYGGAT